ncbi:uncharacterized protein [Watersipora subatra]|uniref:uncharacterized protein n=1 Tax=Watersipora subatra TaxID=2589382 RepID=UPI00355BFCD7
MVKLNIQTLREPSYTRDEQSWNWIPSMFTLPSAISLFIIISTFLWLAVYCYNSMTSRFVISVQKRWADLKIRCSEAPKPIQTKASDIISAQRPMEDTAIMAIGRLSPSEPAEDFSWPTSGILIDSSVSELSNLTLSEQSVSESSSNTSLISFEDNERRIEEYFRQTGQIYTWEDHKKDLVKECTELKIPYATQNSLADLLPTGLLD